MNKNLALILAAMAAISAMTTGCTGGMRNQPHAVSVQSPLGSTDKCSRVVLEDSAIACRMHDDACRPDELSLQTSIESTSAGGSCATVCPGCQHDGGDCIHLSGGRCICA